MLKKIAKAFWHTGEMKNRLTPDDIQIQFVLSFSKLIIGYLSVDQGKWSFEYSEDFKKQTDILPLSNFPNKDQVYSSEELWPFFASRIPSVAQLESKAKVTESEVNDRNEVELLRKYGYKTITNPFTLSAAG